MTQFAVLGRFLSVSGMSFTFNPVLPAGARITSAHFIDADGAMQPVFLDASYWVIAPAFLMEGGDGFAAFAALEGHKEKGAELTYCPLRSVYIH